MANDEKNKRFYVATLPNPDQKRLPNVPVYPLVLNEDQI